MSSDARIQQALAAVALQRTAFRTAAISSLERIRTVLTASHGADHVRQQLGEVGASHIDAGRFAELSHDAVIEAGARAVITRAANFLTEILSARDRDFVVEVAERESSREALASALSRWGRLFGATAAAELARSGKYDRTQHESLLGPWPFDQWTRAQRMVAPPMVVKVKGAEVRAVELAALLDGAMHIVLVIDGECPPAALVRLVTPATLVLQTSSQVGLDRFTAHQGPAIAAMVPDSAATFIHDPSTGTELWQRLTIWHEPETPPRKAIGNSSANQQQQELLQLRALATTPSLPIAAVDTLAPPGAWNGNATDRLTQWLMAQAGDVKPV